MDSYTKFQKLARTIPAVKEFLDSKEVEIALNISRRRTSLYLTQQQLADHAGVNYRDVCRVEGADKGLPKNITDDVLAALDQLEAKNNKPKI